MGEREPINPPMPILYCHHESGHSYKVALIGVSFEQRHVDLNLPRDERDADFQKASLFGEVPVLVFDDGLAVCQSNAILDTLARRLGKLDGRTECERVRVREWLCWEANRIAMSFPHLRFSRRFTPAGPALDAWFSGRMHADFDRLNLALANNDFLVGDRPTIADISCCGYLYWADQADVDLSRWPAIVAWLARIRAQPGWHSPYDLLQAHHPIRTGTRT